eukprot:scaffold5868_cov120-Isochrysis_galbana.AAC.13
MDDCWSTSQACCRVTDDAFKMQRYDMAFAIIRAGTVDRVMSTAYTPGVDASLHTSPCFVLRIQGCISTG